MSARPARVGLMIPSSNTMMEVDFARDLPPGTALHTARMYMEDTTPAGENRMLDEFALPAARDLGTARPDVVVFGCTSAGALRGNDFDAELCQRISELTHAPVVSTIGAVRTAIEACGAASIGVITPYVDELNEKIKASITGDGIDVAGITHVINFDIPGSREDYVHRIGRTARAGASGTASTVAAETAACGTGPRRTGPVACGPRRATPPVARGSRALL